MCIFVLYIHTGKAPTFISTLLDVEAELNTNVVLECKIAGTPQPKITWMRDNVEVTGDRYRFVLFRHPSMLCLTVHYNIILSIKVTHRSVLIKHSCKLCLTFHYNIILTIIVTHIDLC